MLATYSIEYSPRFRKHSPPAHHTYFTDDPVAREGVDLPRPEFDRFIRVAAARLAAQHICCSLNIKPDEERFRFGFTD